MRFPTLLLTGVLALSATASYGLLQHPKKADTNLDLAQALEIRVGDWVPVFKCPMCDQTKNKYCFVVNTASKGMIGQACNEPGATLKNCKQQSGTEETSDGSAVLFPDIHTVPVTPCDVILALKCSFSLSEGLPYKWVEDNNNFACGTKPKCYPGEPVVSGPSDSEQSDTGCYDGSWEE